MLQKRKRAKMEIRSMICAVKIPKKEFRCLELFILGVLVTTMAPRHRMILSLTNCRVSTNWMITVFVFFFPQDLKSDKFSAKAMDAEMDDR